MLRFALVLGLLCSGFVSQIASANTEPTAYDARGVGIGLSGTSYFSDRAALASNPALLKA
ncbi:MAG: hypothetical protein R3A47_05660 [Polyangiales bacterium]